MIEVQVFQEADYRFGVGAITVRVERIDWANPDIYDGEPWYFVDGVQLNSAGAEVGRRQLMVRGRRLPSR
ncbi:hypothetical protein KZZ52_20890 [Dactylosporangium sp. AC04546]|uniref:hypothetical protein n=1 Tax=Dactylosporangium sp. AC04546 TaxID=2862460 RepID=UPI001EDF9C5F|nr:hypothetical protein [Dactylosporangium sp. AC04546]WVK87744.1 hypothetical protein KZZ52_20890 [Dactylosporangium sp. AC04546]